MSNQPAIAELGHVGVRCHDVAKQLAFYTDVLGLTVTDHDEALGIWFLSARPDTEHHELLLAAGRDVPIGAKLIQQVSFRCAEFTDVLAFYRRFKQADVSLDMIVSHGNAIGVYFFDPEGNRCEVYWQTGLQARQPFVQHIDIETEPDDLMDAVRRSVAEHGEQGFTQASYRDWTRRHGDAVATSAGAS